MADWGSLVGVTQGETSGDRARVIVVTERAGKRQDHAGSRGSPGALRMPFLAMTCEGACSSPPGPGTHDPDVSQRPNGRWRPSCASWRRQHPWGVSCVVEYVVRRERPADLQRLSAVADCVVVLTECRAPLERFAGRNRQDRLLNRQPVLEALGYATIDEHTSEAVARMRSVVREMRTDFGLPTLSVNTDDGYEPGLDAIVDFVITGSASTA